MEKFIACLIFIIIMVGAFMFVVTATPSEPCNDIVDENCSWKRAYGVIEQGQ